MFAWLIDIISGSDFVAQQLVVEFQNDSDTMTNSNRPDTERVPMSNALVHELLDTIICPRCQAELPASDDVCGYCGNSTFVQNAADRSAPRHDAQTSRRGTSPVSIAAEVAPETASSASPASSASSTSILDNKWFMLAFLFGAAMFLGIPILWKSRAFSRQGKIWVTVAVMVYSIAIFWGFALVMMWCYQMMTSAGAA